jgi:hypothetical protein
VLHLLFTRPLSGGFYAGTKVNNTAVLGLLCSQDCVEAAAIQSQRKAGLPSFILLYNSADGVSDDVATEHPLVFEPCSGYTFGACVYKSRDKRTYRSGGLMKILIRGVGWFPTTRHRS